MQTILGANGAIGKSLAQQLPQYTNKIRLVSRHPQKVNEGDALVAADLTDASQTDTAVQGSNVVYLTAGLDYKLKVWQAQWPVIMRNVIEACKKHGAKLVFFDNIYMYDKNSLDNITENAPINPPSKKGKVRRQIAQMLLDEVNAGHLTALIARSADFYGPGVNNSMLQQTVLKNLQKGKKANWLADAGKIHSFTYVPDAAKATALLGNTPDAYNQIWHLPTDTKKLTGKDWIDAFAAQLNCPPRYSVLAPGLIKLLGFFIPILKELHEMLYQYDRDYFFNSEKFSKRFPDFRITPSQEGVAQTIAFK